MKYFVIATMLSLAACATGSAIATGQARAPSVAASVRIYASAPAGSDIVGIVTSTAPRSWTAQGTQDNALEELRAQAAKIGANGLVVTNVAEVATGLVGATRPVLTGTAIFVR